MAVLFYVSGQTSWQVLHNENDYVSINGTNVIGGQVRFNGNPNTSQNVVYADFGEDYFDTDFYIKIKLQVDDITGSGPKCPMLMLSDTLDTTYNMQTPTPKQAVGMSLGKNFGNPWMFVNYINTSTGSYYQSGGASFDHGYGDLDNPETVYLVLTSYETTGNKRLAVYFYSDSNFTTAWPHEDLGAVPDDSTYTPWPNFRYLYAVNSPEDYSSDGNVDFTVEIIEINDSANWIP